METQEYKVKQIQPNHADHISYYKQKWLDEMFANDEVILQPKYDGERMLVHFNGDEVYCTSRRYSKKTNRYMENQDKLSKLHTINIGLKYTVVDCECYAKTWSEVVGVLHSLPERAEELQKEVEVKFAGFDCIWYDGQDISSYPYRYRLEKLFDVLKRINKEYFHYAEHMKVLSYDECMTIMEEAVILGFEGVVVKSLEKAYYDKGASLKCKKFETVDCVVYGYTPGRGKYANTVGALWLGYYDDSTNNIVYMCNVNCGTDEDREVWKQYFDLHGYVNEKDEHVLPVDKTVVLEVKCQEITSKSLRHPVYIRTRHDKEYKMCTKETIFKE